MRVPVIFLEPQSTIQVYDGRPYTLACKKGSYGTSANRLGFGGLPNENTCFLCLDLWFYYSRQSRSHPFQGAYYFH